MASYPAWVAALLTWHSAGVVAKPMPAPAYPDICPNGIETVQIQPVVTVAVTPVFVSSCFRENTDITLAPGHVVHVTNAPGQVSTVVAIDDSNINTITTYVFQWPATSPDLMTSKLTV